MALAWLAWWVLRSVAPCVSDCGTHCESCVPDCMEACEGRASAIPCLRRCTARCRQCNRFCRSRLSCAALRGVAPSTSADPILTGGDWR